MLSRAIALVLAFPVLAAVAVIGGCADLNTDLALADGVTIETIDPDRTPRQFAPIGPGQADVRSVRSDSVDRDHWAIRHIVVPVSGVEHRPIWAVGPSYTHDTARQRGEHPSLYSALEQGGTYSQLDEVAEAFAWPFWAGLDVALMLPRMIAQPPWTVMRSPLWRHERAPPGTASPAMLGDPETGVVPGVDARPSVPATSNARWIWRNGKWYYWRPGDPEPWFVAPAEPAAPDQPRPQQRKLWKFKDGKWVREEN
jgi:hypothetical protein